MALETVCGLLKDVVVVYVGISSAFGNETTAPWASKAVAAHRIIEERKAAAAASSIAAARRLANKAASISGLARHTHSLS